MISYILICICDHADNHSEGREKATAEETEFGRVVAIHLHDKCI